VRLRPAGPPFQGAWQALRETDAPSREHDGLHVLDTTMLYGPTTGGVARYLREKRAWLARHTRIRHTVVVPGLRDGVGPYGEILVRTRAFTRSPYRWPYDAPRWVREIVARAPDLIEAGDPGPLGWIALHAAHKLDVPLVSFCHSDVVRLVAQRCDRLCAAFVRRYARVFYGRCDVVVAPSRYMRARLAQWGVDRVVVRPLGVDLDTFSPQRREPDLRRQLGLPRGARLLVYAGRLVPEKNIDVLIDAFRRLGRGYHLVIAGAGRTLPWQANVTQVRYIEGARDLARLLASADALVHAGDQETFGLIFLEAMACGRCVVAPRAGAAPEVVGERAGILVRPRDAKALADGVAAVYDVGYQMLGAYARRRVEQLYSWDATMRGLLDIYRAARAPAPAELPNYAAS
jgi:alpha-1,6-mannosyltransferase